MQNKLPKEKKWANGVFLRSLWSALEEGNLEQIKGKYKLSPVQKKKLKRSGRPMVVKKVKGIKRTNIENKKAKQWENIIVKRLDEKIDIEFF